LQQKQIKNRNTLTQNELEVENIIPFLSLPQQVQQMQKSPMICGLVQVFGNINQKMAMNLVLHFNFSKHKHKFTLKICKKKPKHINTMKKH
jgi:hypothetical protein